MAPTRTLLALAGAAAADGGEGVLRALAEALSALAPHDAGEVALPDAAGLRHLGFGGETQPLVAADLLHHVSSRGVALRVDETDELEAFPRTRERVESAGLRSLLVLPLSGGGGLDGVVVIARHFGWAFVAAPLRELEAVAAMAGVALAQAFALSELEQELATLRENRRVLKGGLDAARERGSDAEHECQRLAERCASLEAELERLRQTLATSRPRRSGRRRASPDGV
jgi:transcriptional regulator with GAF, ATPase, and Fis domain